MATTFNSPNTKLVTLAPGLRPERRFAPLARGLVTLVPGLRPERRFAPLARGLARQSLPFRGNWNQEYGSEQNSNFHQMLLVRAEEDQEIVEWLKRKQIELVEQVYLTRHPKRNDTGFIFRFNYTIIQLGSSILSTMYFVFL